jgi:hypothetical protein
MRCFRAALFAAVVVQAGFGQSAGASVSGTVVDALTGKPVPSAWVLAIREGTPPLRQVSKSGGAGEFRLEGLAAGEYQVCVQAQEQGYVDPCQWGARMTTVKAGAGEAVAGVVVRLAAGTIVTVRVEDAGLVLEQKTKDWRQPDLSVGVWGPNGLYYAARSGVRMGGPKDPQSGEVVYRMLVPVDTALKLDVVSRDLRLGDGEGRLLAGSASRQQFQQSSGDSPKVFAFKVLGQLP